MPVRWVPFDHGYGSRLPRPEEELLRIHFEDAPEAAPPSLGEIKRDIATLDTKERCPSRSISRMGQGMALVMGINGVPSWQAQPLMAHVGETRSGP